MNNTAILIKKYYFGRYGKCYSNVRIVATEDLAIQYELNNPLSSEWHYEFEVLPFGLPELSFKDE